MDMIREGHVRTKFQKFGNNLFYLFDIYLFKIDIVSNIATKVCELPTAFCDDEDESSELRIIKDKVWIASIRSNRIAVYDLKECCLHMVEIPAENENKEGRCFFFNSKDRLLIISMFDLMVYEITNELYCLKHECISKQIFKELKKKGMDFIRVRYDDALEYDDKLIINVSTRQGDLYFVFDILNMKIKEILLSCVKGRCFGMYIDDSRHLFFQEIENAKSYIVEWDLDKNVLVDKTDISKWTCERVYIKSFWGRIIIVFFAGKIYQFSKEEKKLMPIWEKPSRLQQFSSLHEDGEVIVIDNNYPVIVDVGSKNNTIINYSCDNLKSFIELI